MNVPQHEGLSSQPAKRKVCEKCSVGKEPKKALISTGEEEDDDDDDDDHDRRIGDDPQQ